MEARAERLKDVGGKKVVRLWLALDQAKRAGLLPGHQPQRQKLSPLSALPLRSYCAVGPHFGSMPLAEGW